MLIRMVRRRAPRSNRSHTFCDSNMHTKISNNSQRFRVNRYPSLNSVLQTPGLIQKKTSEDVLSVSNRRQMATATSFSSEEIPFESTNSPPPSMMSSIKGFGRNLIVPHLGTIEGSGMARQLESKTIRRGRLGLSGDLSEIIPVFEACVHVGRLERARIILDKLHEKTLSEYDAVRCNNIFLRAAVEQIIISPKKESHMQELHRWFETNKEVKGVPFDTETIAYMLKLSLQSTDDRRDRLVKRYMDLLDEDSFIDLIESDLLTGDETGLITEIYPKFNFALELDEEIFAQEQIESQSINKNDMTDQASKSQPSTLLETKQKGIGLKSLKASLSLFTKFSSEGIDLETASEDVKREIQMRLEQDAVQAAIERWRNEHASLVSMGIESNLLKRSLGSLLWKWHISLEEKVVEELQKIAESEKAEKKVMEDIDRCSYGPLLQILSPGQLSAITIITTMTVIGQYNDRRPPISTIVLDIGQNVEDESSLLVLQRLLKGKQTELSETKTRFSPEFCMKLRRSRGPGATSKYLCKYFGDTGIRPWPPALRAKLGATLLSFLIEAAKVSAYAQNLQTKEKFFQVQPAFTHGHQYRKGKRSGVLLLNKVVLDQLIQEPVHSLLAKHLPMISIPEKWSGFADGGYVIHPSNVMRIKYGDKDQRRYCEAAIAQGDMSTVFKGLDVLGKTPWRINKAVFDVMAEIWNSGEQIANFPPVDPQFEYPPEPKMSTDPVERSEWMRKIRRIENAKIGLHSQRCFQNFQLEIARALVDKVFYFPHNIDFRGRAYPIPPYLNHIGADHCRGLLIFAEGKELGENGLRWLKIHVSNVFGYDKASLQERENFTSSKIDEIYDSAMYPMTGRKWWLTAEDPWQCLASCMELKNALDSPDPSKYVSHMPIHQDGTCNGLQHYAALGGDVWGAKQVNLEPGDRPADIYSAVADLVRESVAKDKLAGSKTAEYLHGQISRKTVKQTVMTNVYGVTFIGASAQVRKQLALKDHRDSSNPISTKNTLETRMKASLYVAHEIFKALSTMFSGSHEIQRWLGVCAERITSSLSAYQLEKLNSVWDKVCLLSSDDEPTTIKPTRKKKNTPSEIFDEIFMFKSGITWTSPLGMPVVQPYRITKAKSVRTSVQLVHLAEPSLKNPVCKRKQSQGFPPNFIHSLDASHMILSAIGCEDLGLTFAAVHDSFWTHACDIDTMNSVLREKFVEIHSHDVIGRLKTEFEARYQGSFYFARIPLKLETRKKISKCRSRIRNSSKLNSSKSNIKSLRLAEELLMEVERHKLLSSSNPQDVKKAEEMETPRSIYENSVKQGNDLSVDEYPFTTSQDIDSTEELVNSNAYLELDSDEDGDSLDTFDADMKIDKSVADSTENSAESSVEELNKSKKEFSGSKNHSRLKNELIWLPLKFPKIPDKGDFDVKRLLKSTYFFS